MTEPTEQERVFLAESAWLQIKKKYRVKMACNDRGEFWIVPEEEKPPEKPELRVV